MRRHFGGVPEVAEALGIAETTVKTYLGRTYQKTGQLPFSGAFFRCGFVLQNHNRRLRSC
jgi:hypothetical protein